MYRWKSSDSWTVFTRPRLAFLLCLAVLTSCRSPADVFRPSTEAEIRKALERGTGTILLPAQTVTIHQALRIPEGARELLIRGHPEGSVLRAADDFAGRALITANSATGLELRDFSIDGNRSALEEPVGLPPSNVSFAQFYENNGIVIENASGLLLRDLSLREVANFAVIVSASSNVQIEALTVTDSGSKNELGRNNTSGGILIEEGTTDFEVRECRIERVLGNGVWTHSNYHSPRNASGIIRDNDFQDLGRDAVQVGHATNVRVEGNGGSRIGYPFAIVDVESWGTPVAVDTAGDVDRSVYVDNHFRDVNGQCIDLDGFHHGEVRSNSCINRKAIEEYPFGHYGIVFGNTNPDMEPVGVTIEDNLIDGATYGGIFLIGSQHTVADNRFLNLNRARCTGDFSTAVCNWGWQEPGMLRSGIYLGRGAERPADTRDNVVRDNEVVGFGMDRWCVGLAPGVEENHNVITGNDCKHKP